MFIINPFFPQIGSIFLFLGGRLKFLYCIRFTTSKEKQLSRKG